MHKKQIIGETNRSVGLGIESKLIDYLAKTNTDIQILKHNGKEFCTSRSLFNKGIKVCDLCGAFMPLEKTDCKCGNEVYVFLELSKKERTKIDKILNKTDTFKVTGINKKTLETENLVDNLSLDEVDSWLNTEKLNFKKTHKFIQGVKVK